MKLEKARMLLNTQLNTYYEGRKSVQLFQVSHTNFVLSYVTPAAEYQFAQGNDLNAMSGYLQALSNIINLSGELGLEQVEQLLKNSLQHINKG